MEIQIKKIQPVHSDERRDILELVNGDFVAKQVKIIQVHGDNVVLGMHYHRFRQFFYVMSGTPVYSFLDIHTQETITETINPGTLIIIGKEVAHKAIMSSNCITLEGNEEPFTSATECDVPYQF